MNKNTKKIVIWILVGVVCIAGVYSLIVLNNRPAKLDNFAKCLKDKGAVFYGAFWCPHCQNQKALFGKSEKFLPYVECSTPDGNGQQKVCADKQIKGYPHWEFTDGSSKSGELTLEELAQKTSCALPQ